MSKIFFRQSIILWLTFLSIVSSGCANRKVRASIPVEPANGRSMDERVAIRAEKIRDAVAEEKARKEKEKKLPPLQKQAYKDIKKAAQQRQKNINKYYETRRKSELSCRNISDKDRVVIDPDAVDFWDWQAFWRVTFYNHLDVDVNIKMNDTRSSISEGTPDEHYAVENLGPGCSITLNRSLRASEVGLWGSIISISFVVQSIDGSYFMTTRDFLLYPGNSFPQRNKDNVHIGTPPNYIR